MFSAIFLENSLQLRAMLRLDRSRRHGDANVDRQKILYEV
jgi:hypothetical protein